MFEEFTKHHAIDKIRINEVYWATRNTDGENVKGFTAERIEEANRFLKERYTYLKGHLPTGCFITYPEDMMVADVGHKWGESPFHYVQNFYGHTISSLVSAPVIASDSEKNPISGVSLNHDSDEKNLGADANQLDCRVLFRMIIGGDFSALKSNGYVARAGLAPVILSVPMKWTSTDRNLEFNLHAWRFMNAAWSHYVRNPTDLVAEEIFSFNMQYIMDWVSFVRSHKCKHAWYDMAVGIRAMHLAFMKYIIARHAGVASEDDIKLVDVVSLEHISWLSDQANITKGNHAIYEILGLRILLLQYGMDAYENYADDNMSALIDAAFDEFYVGTENSPFYHKYNVDIFSKIPPVLFPKIEGKIQNIVKNGSLITKWLTAPDGTFYRIGDTEGNGVLLTARDTATEGFLSDASVVYKDLGESGYQIVRSHPGASKDDAFSLVFRGGPSSDVHAHCDALSFVFFQGGEEVFADPGKYTYEYGEQRDWFVSDAAHNTAGLLGKVFFSRDIRLEKTGLCPMQIAEDRYVLSGRVQKSDEFFHKRELVFYPNNMLLILDYIDNRAGLNSEVRYLLGEGFEYYGDAEGGEIRKRHLSFRVFISGDVESFSYSSPENSDAWISKVYASKYATGFIRIQCPRGVSRIKMLIDLA